MTIRPFLAKTWPWLALLGLVASWLPARAQRPDDRPPAPPIEEDREERLAEAKLELQILEGRLAVRQAELKVEEERLVLARAVKKNSDDSVKARISAPTLALVASVDVLDAEARVLARRAELDEATARYEAAKRRLTEGRLPAPDPASKRFAEVDRRLMALDRRVEFVESRILGSKKY